MPETGLPGISGGWVGKFTSNRLTPVNGEVGRYYEASFRLPASRELTAVIFQLVAIVYLGMGA